MIEAAEVGADDRVLEVGAGSGYAAAVISRIAGHVFAIERHEALGQAARERLEALEYRNVELRIGDGTLGLPDQAPRSAEHTSELQSLMPISYAVFCLKKKKHK